MSPFITISSGDRAGLIPRKTIWYPPLKCKIPIDLDPADTKVSIYANKTFPHVYRGI